MTKYFSEESLQSFQRNSYYLTNINHAYRGHSKKIYYKTFVTRHAIGRKESNRAEMTVGFVYAVLLW